MKWQDTPQFRADWKALPAEHQRRFRELLPAFSAACDAFLAAPGSFRWPSTLRVTPMKSAPGIWEMTWSFAGPDGRATFEFASEDGDQYVRWRRIGTHAIYRKP